LSESIHHPSRLFNGSRQDPHSRAQSEDTPEKRLKKDMEWGILDEEREIEMRLSQAVLVR
jgi:hypothetical protein